MDDHLRELVNQAYDKILGTANGIVRNCKTTTMEFLQQKDPSYEEIARQLTIVSGMIDVIYNVYPDDPDAFRTSVKAREYAQSIEKIAGAIRLDDEELLEEYVNELDGRPFL